MVGGAGRADNWLLGRLIELAGTPGLRGAVQRSAFNFAGPRRRRWRAEGSEGLGPEKTGSRLSSGRRFYRCTRNPKRRFHRDDDSAAALATRPARFAVIAAAGMTLP